MGIRITDGHYELYSGKEALLSKPIPRSDFGKWILLAAGCSGKRVIFYRNATALGSRTLSSPMTGGLISIGAAPDGKSQFYKGAVDELAVWSRVLPRDEIEKLWKLGKAGKSIAEGSPDILAAKTAKPGREITVEPETDNRGT